MAIATFHNGRTISSITGGNGLHRVDVDLVSGKRRMATDAVVTVEQLFGRPGFSAVWFAIGTFDDCSGVGNAGDTIRIEIAAGCLPALYPAVDLIYVVTAGDVAAAQPEISVRDAIISALNSDADFQKSWRADDIKNNGIVFIESKLRAEKGDRIIPGDFAVTPTGTTITSIAFDVIARRGTETELVRSIDDPRQGILGISGSVSVIPTGFPNRFNEDAKNLGSANLAINGQGAPKIFRVDAVANFDVYVNEIRIHGLSNGVKFGKFLNLNSVLSNGMEIKVKTDDIITTERPIKSTDDLKARFSTSGAWNLDIQAGGDHILASQVLGNFPFVLRAQGTFGVGQDDYFEILIQDNLSQVSNLFCTIVGFEREP